MTFGLRRRSGVESCEYLICFTCMLLFVQRCMELRALGSWDCFLANGLTIKDDDDDNYEYLSCRY